jgi:hypothetical protein
VTVAEVFALVRRTLEDRVHLARGEEWLQKHVAAALRARDEIDVSTEVIDASGRFDIVVVTRGDAPVRVVLELKVRAAVAAVERQAQRYAMSHGVDGVAVVTTSRRLARQLADMRTLGGKPFTAIALRSW